MSRYPFCRQADSMDCGAACLSMICSYYGRHFSLETLRDYCCISREGSSMLGVSHAAESIGFKTVGVRTDIRTLCDAPLPCIVHWKQNHYVVLYSIKMHRRRRSTKENDGDAADVTGTVVIGDPAIGIVKYSLEEFMGCWISNVRNGKEEGIALIIEPTPLFFSNTDERDKKISLKFLTKYLKPYRRLIVQLFLGLLAGTMLQTIAPFLTQAIVDYGIKNNSLGFIVLILIAQLTIYIAQTAVEFIRSWILLHISTRVNISLISDFLIKLMKLPISFFDSKKIGDIMQRIDDHARIRNFLTVSTLNTLFSMVSLLVFTVILAFYSIRLLCLFIVASAVYVIWVTLFMKKRRVLDHTRFTFSAAEQSKLYQMINGMQEIKLNNCERQKRWEWEHLQAKLFKVSTRSLALSQYQQSGAVFINETKNILISFFSAKAVIDGDFTLGMMMAVSFIIAQLNSPIAQIISFVQSAQDAKISLERLFEIHGRDDEEYPGDGKLTTLPDCHDIKVDNLSFRYSKLGRDVLQNVSLTIPQGKVTAIVGVSGSGKTTLMKLLLGFYSSYRGEITIGGVDIHGISSRTLRKACGTVMQDGFIFSDSIAGNIAVGDEYIDRQRLSEVARMANIIEFVDSQPMGFNTKIGAEGKGISQGQRQRILIARALYKNPPFLFFDEATNALDATNERVIMDNLRQVFVGRTVVIIAHRLSTVKNADNIVVLDNGTVAEQGTHESLVLRHGRYYELVKNQLELGK